MGAAGYDDAPVPGPDRREVRACLMRYRVTQAPDDPTVRVITPCVFVGRYASGGEFDRTRTVPGGGVEMGESDQQAAIREVSEEVVDRNNNPLVIADGEIVYTDNNAMRYQPLNVGPYNITTCKRQPNQQTCGVLALVWVDLTARGDAFLDGLKGNPAPVSRTNRAQPAELSCETADCTWVPLSKLIADCRDREQEHDIWHSTREAMRRAKALYIAARLVANDKQTLYDLTFGAGRDVTNVLLDRSLMYPHNGDLMGLVRKVLMCSNMTIRTTHRRELNTLASHAEKAQREATEAYRAQQSQQSRGVAGRSQGAWRTV